MSNSLLLIFCFLSFTVFIIFFNKIIYLIGGCINKLFGIVNEKEGSK